MYRYNQLSNNQLDNFAKYYICFRSVKFCFYNCMIHSAKGDNI